MFRFDDETRRILIEIIELFGYLLLGVALWELTKSVLVIVIYALLILCLLLLLRYRVAHQELTKLQKMLGTAGRSAEELQRVQHLFEGMLGLFLYTTEQPISDAKHHFAFLQEEYVVHGDDGIYNWTLKGCNVLDDPSLGLTIKLSGDTPADVSSLALSVLDKATEQRYQDKQIKVIRDFPYLKIFDIAFPEPLAKGKWFDLRLSCRWDNTFTRSRKYDYVFFAWGYYAIQRIDKLVGRLVCDVPITDFVLERLDSGRLIKERSQPKLVDTASRHFVLEWEVSNPQHVYILRFAKEVGDTSRSA